MSWKRVSSAETAYKTLRVSRFHKSSGNEIPFFASTFGTVGKSSDGWATRRKLDRWHVTPR